MKVCLENSISLFLYERLTIPTPTSNQSSTQQGAESTENTWKWELWPQMKKWWPACTETSIKYGRLVIGEYSSIANTLIEERLSAPFAMNLLTMTEMKEILRRSRSIMKRRSILLELSMLKWEKNGTWSCRREPWDFAQIRPVKLEG